MFTAISGSFNFSKDGKLAKKIYEGIEDCVKGVTIHTYNGTDYFLNCDDFTIMSVKEVSYDTHEEDVLKDGITECYGLDESKDLENSHIIKLNGVCFKVVRYKDLVLLNNETTNAVEYECKIDEFKELLESVDKHYKVYIKEHIDL